MLLNPSPLAVMHWFATLNLVGTALLLLLASFTGQQAVHRRNVSFILLLLAMANYSLALAFESLTTELTDAWFWNRIQYLSIPFLPSLMLLVVGRYVGLSFQRPWLRAVLVGCFGFSLLITLLHGSSPWHDLFYRDIAYTEVGGIAAVGFTPGPFYHLFDVFYFSIAAIVLALVGRRVVQVYGLLKAQAIAVCIGIALPWAFALVGDFAPVPTQLDIIPLAFVPSALVLGFGVLNWGLLGLEPIVMRTVFAAIPSGCIIVDHRRRLLDYNAAAQRMFPRLTQLKTGQSIESIHRNMPGFGAALEALNDTQGHQAGDEVLKAVARCARDQCRHGDKVGDLSHDYHNDNLVVHAQSKVTVCFSRTHGASSPTRM